MAGFAVAAGILGVALVAGFTAAEPQLYDLLGYLTDLVG